MPAAGRPVLLYLYNGHEIEDENAARSRTLEKSVFTDRRVIEAARGFVCEKICFGCSELSLRYEHRQMLRDYLDRCEAAPARESHAVLLAPDGQVLEVLKEKPTAAKLVASLKRAAG